MKRLYSLDVQKLGLLLLPTRLRQPLLMAVFRAICCPLQSLHVGFTRFRGDVSYTLGHNGQVCYLVAALNDALDSQFRRIQIGEVFRAEPVIFYKQSDRKPVVFDDSKAISFYSQSAFGSNPIDFEVLIPTSLFTVSTSAFTRSEGEIIVRNILSQYKLASKRYKITNI